MISPFSLSLYQKKLSAVSIQLRTNPPDPPFVRGVLLIRLFASPFRKGGSRGFSCTVVRPQSYKVFLGK
ncbi:protein of unknown function [Candidatus Methylomirabilis oxygeniifera]|uniref:Uncharacterized protein n=1 Tax=Methylomirabilis oxygeniifera TaxID=671143 RepID=D5MLC1_METO1|nr:protein of unknown function [Candidatus Methylomirabilis oxyfera]